MDKAKKNGDLSGSERRICKGIRQNGIWFMAGLLSSLSPFFYTHPFGVSLLCASDKGGLPLLAGIAASAAFGAAGPAELCCDIAVVLIKYLIFEKKKKTRRSSDGTATAIKTSLSCIAGGIPLLIVASSDVITPVGVHIINILVIPLITFFMCGLFIKRSVFGKIHRTAGIVCVSLCAVFLAARVSIGGVSLPFILASVVTLATAERSGIVFGGLSGFLGAFASDMASIPALGCAGLISGLFFRYGKAAGTLSFALTASAVYLYFNDMNGALPLTLELAISAAIYIPLSKRIPESAFPRYESEEDKSECRADAAEPFAEAFSDISGALYTISGIRKKEKQSEGNAASFSEMIAGNCAAVSETIKSRERKKESESKKNKRLTAKAMCCLSVMGIKGDRLKVTGERKVIVKIYGVNPEALVHTGQEISDKLSDACGVRFGLPVIEKNGRRRDMILSAIPVISAESAQLCITKKGEKICGDTVRSFITDDGMSYHLICDGMGSGKDAALSSKLAATSLEKLLKAGADTNAAINAVNNFLLSSSDETFTTVDLLCVDTYTSKISIVKAGAAPTFTVSDKKITITGTKALPIGIFGKAAPQMTYLDVMPGDYIIMTSDGASGDDGDGYGIISLAVRRDYSDASELSLKIYEEILGQKRCADDVSVCVVRIVRS